MWLVKECRRRGELRLLPIAIGLMIYPYFTKGPWADWGVGIALCALVYKLWR